MKSVRTTAFIVCAAEFYASHLKLQVSSRPPPRPEDTADSSLVKTLTDFTLSNTKTYPPTRL